MSEIETGTNNPSFSATFINDRPMRPNPWMAILLMMCLLMWVRGLKAPWTAPPRGR